MLEIEEKINLLKMELYSLPTHHPRSVGLRNAIMYLETFLAMRK